ncbi:MAG: hypothetical protein IJT49_07235 [Clostridia bacterium]|nr:hypothetical protein [Clostridia bacterium]
MRGFPVKDHTAEYEEEDIQKGRFLSVLCYLWIFVLIPVFAAKDSGFVRFHRRQGLLTFIINTVYAVLMFVILDILRVTVGSLGVFIVGILLYGGLAALAALPVAGIINAVKGKAKELPYIGSFAEKFKSE